jgi:hypothetical protein
MKFRGPKALPDLPGLWTIRDSDGCPVATCPGGIHKWANNSVSGHLPEKEYLHVLSAGLVKGDGEG